MSAIERRYQRLLRAYPGWYREQRGDEMLGTLMAAAPSGRWPSRRDSWALLTGGLRVRAGQDQRLGTRANLRLAALFGVALSLAWLMRQPADLDHPALGARRQVTTIGGTSLT